MIKAVMKYDYALEFSSN